MPKAIFYTKHWSHGSSSTTSIFLSTSLCIAALNIMHFAFFYIAFRLSRLRGRCVSEPSSTSYLYRTISATFDFCSRVVNIAIYGLAAHKDWGNGQNFHRTQPCEHDICVCAKWAQFIFVFDLHFILQTDPIKYRTMRWRYLKKNTEK